MKQVLEKESAFIDAIYYCPHHPEANIEKYRLDCDCRKPKPGMLRKAREDLKIDLSCSFMVGDQWSDVEAAHSAGCRAIMVNRGCNDDRLDKCNLNKVAYIATSLYNAIEWIIKQGQDSRVGIDGRTA